MLAHRRQYRPLDTNNNIIVEATSETALQDKTTPDETLLPLSQATSPIKDVASNVYARPMSRDLQQESSPNHDREKCTQERVVIQEEAGDHEAIAHEVTPAGKNSVEALDPIAEGQKKLAEFWPIYVKEADSFDRELSEGWNNMLEVILIFAALFSAISTAFVLESSKDLKPDPAESAATTLILISQTLLVISNQSALAPASVSAGPSPFVPTSSAIAVNILWFTSLILSVSVTLLAMLAKEWSHFFMVGRTGMPMEQARKRQKRFDGMKIWKMEGVITALPTLMHLALFLFAAGLCVYLWNIHISVAVPVVILTLLTVLVYVAALVVPLIHDSCPYATALSKLIKPHPGTWSRKREAQPELDVPSNKVPMDATTSRTLAWMISNSEVPSSVDHALRAIAGTSFEMPNEALWECEVSHVIYSRLRPCLDIRNFGFPGRLTTVQLKRIIESDSSILAYSLVLNLMASERRELTITNLDTADRPNDASVWLDYCENLYNSLRTHSSPHMSAIGYAARGLRFWCGTLYEHDRSSHLLKVSNLGVLAWEQQDTQSSTLHFMIFTAMCREAIYWDASSLELVAQRPQILRNMIVIISHAAEVDLSSNEFMSGLCAVGLAMNRHTNTRFGEVATHFFASDNQVKILQKLGNLCGVLGVSGLLCALKSDGLYESLQESALKPFFDLLWTYVADKGALVELPSDALENLGIARRIFETIYDCRQCLTRRDISIESLDEVLGYMLRHEHEPWLTPIAAVLLEESANYSLLDDCVRFVAQNEPRETEIGTVLLSNTFYEAAQHETASPVSADNILRLTQHFETVSANEGKDIHVVIRALLERLLDNDMFYCLLLLMGRTRSIGTLRRWQGTRVGPVVRFWGEHIIAWAHSVQRESGSSDIAERLRESLSNREPGIVSEQVLEDAADLVNLLERKINQPENSSFTLYDRISRWMHLTWRNRQMDTGFV